MDEDDNGEGGEGGAEDAYPPLMLSILQAGAASSKAYARVWQRTKRNVLLDGKPARRREVVLQI